MDCNPLAPKITPAMIPVLLFNCLKISLIPALILGKWMIEVNLCIAFVILPIVLGIRLSTLRVVFCRVFKTGITTCIAVAIFPPISWNLTACTVIVPFVLSYPWAILPCASSTDCANSASACASCCFKLSYSLAYCCSWAVVMNPNPSMWLESPNVLPTFGAKNKMPNCAWEPIFMKT